eukprot:gene2219-2533_t
MVKAVQAEDIIERYFEGLLKQRVQAEVRASICAYDATGKSNSFETSSRGPFLINVLEQLLLESQVGLLVGKASVGSRDLALAVVPTPTQDGEQRDAIAKAVLELKADVVQSLAARAQLLLGDAADAEAEAAEVAAAEARPAAAGGGLKAVVAHPLLLTAAACKLMSCGLPRRVLLPWDNLQLQVTVE